MSQQQYLWVLGLLAAWLQEDQGGNDGGCRLEGRRRHAFDRIDAVAGQFRRAPSNAANDLTAYLLILVLVWWWFYAKTRANLIERSAFSRETVGPPILALIPPHPAWLLVFPVLESVLVSVPKRSPPHNAAVGGSRYQVRRRWPLAMPLRLESAP